MKNVYEVLRQKEMELTRLEKEVEALRLVAPLLSEGMEMNSDAAKATLPNRRERTAAADPHPGASRGSRGAAGARCRVGRYRQALAVNSAVCIGHSCRLRLLSSRSLPAWDHVPGYRVSGPLAPELEFLWMTSP